jgi:diaminohydroxyphosphoribosylaminopyrimidine deaminase/5-amino-6-(5-phosphoribosylamino)uracil reductase
MSPDPSDVEKMNRALQLALNGQGHVEPNPLVGCVIVRDAKVVGEGWHREFGGPHAEIEALRVAGNEARGGTMFVTLEPCCHQGKTPPCTRAIINAGLAKVVVAHQDPFPAVAGQGIEQLKQAGIRVEVGIGHDAARQLNAPFCKRVERQRPWIIGKWAMTLDGKMATRTGHSQWVSSPASREIVHQLRGRVDAIMIGSGTAKADDPLLTARPAGPRLAARVVVDAAASLSMQSQLVRTVDQAPVIIAVGTACPPTRQQQLADAGCQMVVCPGDDHLQRLDSLLAQLAQREMTNVLVEGGGRLLGNLLDLRQIDEVHVFIGPKLVGGKHATSPIEGLGLEQMDQSLRIKSTDVQKIDGDIYVCGSIDNTSTE